MLIAVYHLTDNRGCPPNLDWVKTIIGKKDNFNLYCDVRENKERFFSDRPSGRELLRSILKKDVNTLVVYEVAYFTRNTTELVYFLRICMALKIKLISFKEGELTNNIGKLDNLSFIS